MATPATDLRVHPRLYASAARALTIGAVLLAAFPAAAARISEPDTVLYGRIVQVVGEREFPITSGLLVWNLRTAGTNGLDYQLTTRLKPLADGRFSYELRIPHQFLAYDLTVNAVTVPMMVRGTSLEHVSVTLDGRPLTINPAAVSGFTVSPVNRAAAQRIDLALSGAVVDSDGDALPDWWEDEHGFDKWDPADAADLPGGFDPSGVSLDNARTFAQWRAALFPNDTSDLETFAAQDPDQDGIVNFLEYAFDLNPSQSDLDVVNALPRPCAVDGRMGIIFRQRKSATDLFVQVEVSSNLLEWQDGTSQLEAVVPASGPDTQRVYLSQSTAQTTEAKFFRVRVSRK